MKKVLIVEDDTLVLKAYHDKFVEEGFEVHDALDGEQGLAVALNMHPDAIFLDLNMPRMDGMTVMKKLREDVWGRKVPIVIITNLELNDDRLKGVVRDEPAFYLLKKNYTLEDLVSKVKEVTS